MRQPRLLVVDDNRELAESLTELFGARGFQVKVARSAAGGVALARESGFDLALVDINLPDSSGLELLPALRAASPVGEVLVITGHAAIDTAIAAVRGGAFHYVVKPFKPEDLIATAESALRQVALRAERSELEQQLAVSERRYRDVVESTQVLVVVLDAEGLIRLVNRRAAECTGRNAAELLGAGFAETLLAPDAHQRFADRLHRVLRGQPSDEFEAPLLASEGAVRVVRWHITASLAPDPSHPETPPAAPGVYMVGTDVTERLALERRAAEAEALAHMGTLAAGLAHEIRNPLNAAGLQLHLLSRNVERLAEDERPTLRSRIEIVAGELKRLERLLSDFLELARPRPIDREPVDMLRLLDEVVALHEPSAQQRGVLLTKSLQRGVAYGDRERLKQIFHNLVVNALEATSTGDSITLEGRAETREGAPCFVVVTHDTGRGIPRAVVERIFDPFFTTKAAGTGLGLTIVRQLVQRHGGSVRIESVEGQSTTITVTLPAPGAP